MPAPYTAGAQVRIKGEIHGQQTVNVLNFGTNVAISDAGDATPLMVALLAAVIACVVDTLIPAVTADWKFNSVDGKFIYNSGALAINNNPMEDTPVGAPVPGEGGAASVSFAAALMQIRTATGGRSGRGRIFLPPCGEDQTENSAMLSAASVNFGAFVSCMAGKFIGEAKTEQWELGVLSYKNAGVNNANFDTAFHPATTLNMVADLAVLSKRKKGHGR